MPDIKPEKNRENLLNFTKNPNSYISYDNARTIGILYESRRGEDILEINQYINKLSNDKKEVYSLKYIVEKVPKEDLAEIAVNTLKKYTVSKKDMNIFGKFKKNSIQSFIDMPFDILINLTSRSNLKIHHISKKSKARLKVSHYNEKLENVYQLMIHYPDSDDLNQFIPLVDKYINMLNSK